MVMRRRCASRLLRVPIDFRMIQWPACALVFSHSSSGRAQRRHRDVDAAIVIEIRRRRAMMRRHGRAELRAPHRLIRRETSRFRC